MPFHTIQFSIENRIAQVVLDRPEIHNAYDTQMRDELHEVFSACALDTEIDVVVLRGAGRSFCAGADLSEFGSAPTPFVARRIRFQRDVWRALASIKVPVIAALHGYVIGTGLEMAMLCDVRIAADSMTIRMPEAALGIIPAATGTQTLPRLIGGNSTARLLFTGERISASTALELAIVHRVVPADQLLRSVSDIATELSARERQDNVTRKFLLRRALTGPSVVPAVQVGDEHALHANIARA